MSARRTGSRVETAGRLNARSRGMWADGRALLRMSVCGGKLVGGGERNGRERGRAQSLGDLGEPARVPSWWFGS